MAIFEKVKVNKNKLTLKDIYIISVFLIATCEEDFDVDSEWGHFKMGLIGLDVFQRYGDGADLEDSVEKICEKTFMKFFDMSDMSDMSDISKQKIDDFLQEIASELSEKHKYSLLIKLYDILLLDGVASEDEQRMFYKFLEAFDIVEEDIEPYLESIQLKNDLELFR